MKARLKNPAMIVTEAMAPLTGLGKLLQASPIPGKTLALVNLRVSQNNGCAVCIDGQIKKLDETPQCMAAVAVCGRTRRSSATPSARRSRSPRP